MRLGSPAHPSAQAVPAPEPICRVESALTETGPRKKVTVKPRASQGNLRKSARCIASPPCGGLLTCGWTKFRLTKQPLASALCYEHLLFLLRAARCGPGGLIPKQHLAQG